LLFSLNLSAQELVEELEPSIVTSDLREETLAIETPTSLSVLDSQTLKKAGTQHFEDVLGLVPNLNWSSASNRPRYFQIRGIGERSQYEGAPNPSVGFIVDDIDFSALGAVATLFDVDQIEVLRGPQGTRFGANALAGLIYVKSKDPEFNSSYKLSGLLGSDDDKGFGFSATGGLSKTAAYRLSINKYTANGFRQNDYLNRDDTNRRNEFVARAKVFWQANDALDFNFTLLKADINNGFDTFNPENTFITHSDFQGRDAQDSTGLAIKSHWQGSQFQLLSISSYMNADSVYSFDGDWGNDDYWGEFSPYDFTSSNLRNRTHLSQEFRFIADHWLFGIYALKLRENNLINEFFNSSVYKNLNSNFTATSVAAFAEVNQSLSPSTEIVAGVRFENRSADYRDSNGISVAPNDFMWGGKISLKHRLSQSVNAYLTFARGYKAGGFNLSTSVPEALREYQPESLWSLESGIKGSFLDYQLQWNLSAFYSKRQDMQISTSQQTDPNDPLTFVFFTGNAATGSNYGLESDFSYLLSSNFNLFGSVGLLKAQFDNFSTGLGDFDGRDQAHAPRYNFSLGLEYHRLNGFFARFDASGKDSFFFSDTNSQQSKSYQVYYLRIGYEKESWSVTLWGNNIFNKKFATRGFFFGLEPPNYEDTLYTQLGSPRHLGLSFDFNF